MVDTVLTELIKAVGDVLLMGEIPGLYQHPVLPVPQRRRWQWCGQDSAQQATQTQGDLDGGGRVVDVRAQGTQPDVNELADCEINILEHPSGVGDLNRGDKFPPVAFRGCGPHRQQWFPGVDVGTHPGLHPYDRPGWSRPEELAVVHLADPAMAGGRDDSGIVGYVPVLADIDLLQVGGHRVQRFRDPLPLIGDEPGDVTHLQAVGQMVQVDDDADHRDQGEHHCDRQGDLRGRVGGLPTDIGQDQHAVEERAHEQADDPLAQPVPDE